MTEEDYKQFLNAVKTIKELKDVLFDLLTEEEKTKVEAEVRNAYERTCKDEQNDQK